MKKTLLLLLLALLLALAALPSALADYSCTASTTCSDGSSASGGPSCYASQPSTKVASDGEVSCQTTYSCSSCSLGCSGGTCTVPVCGNGIKEGSEVCDGGQKWIAYCSSNSNCNGNLVSDCTSSCTWGSAYCSGGNACTGGDICTDKGDGSYACEQPPCTPVNGGWSAWGSWSSCSASCDGTQTRARTCSSPSPSCGGSSCLGSSSETQSCNTGACFPSQECRSGSCVTVTCSDNPVGCDSKLDCPNNQAGVHCAAECASNLLDNMLPASSSPFAICGGGICNYICTECNVNSDCAASKPYCVGNTVNTVGKCVQCLSNSDCSGSTPICNTATNTCETGCLTNANCGGSTPVCDTAAKKCVECNTASDCKSYACAGGDLAQTFNTIQCSSSKCVRSDPNPYLDCAPGCGSPICNTYPTKEKTTKYDCKWDASGSNQEWHYNYGTNGYICQVGSSASSCEYQRYTVSMTVTDPCKPGFNCVPGEAKDGGGCKSTCDVTLNTGCAGGYVCRSDALGKGVCQTCDSSFSYSCVGSDRFKTTCVEAACGGTCSSSFVESCSWGCSGGSCNPPPCTATELMCTDGKDNDCDGKIDLADSDCDPDLSPAICAAAGKLWRTGGEPAPFGQYDTGMSTECCGDDAGENAKSRLSSCNAASCSANDFPEFSSLGTDAVCCNDPDDAVFNGKCYEDDKDYADAADVSGGPYKYDGTAVSIAAGVPNMIAEKGNWYDCDNSPGACTEARTAGRCGLSWAAGGEAAAFGEYNTGTAAECCGDDSGEFYKASGLGGKTACCNAATDCVDGAGACVSDGTLNGATGLVCMSGSWTDADADAAACVSGGGEFNIGGEVALGQCCGNNPDEFIRFRECRSGSCLTNAADRVCCDAQTDCVFNGKCYYDVNIASGLITGENAAFCGSKTTENACVKGTSKQKCSWDSGGTKCVPAVSRAAVHLSQKTGGSYPAYADINNDGKDEVCVAASPGKWEGASPGTMSGVVVNVTHPVQDVVVRVIGEPLSAVTAADGTYSILNVPAGSHDLTASLAPYETDSALALFVPDGGTVTADFIMARPAEGCNYDCTKADGLCHAECDGKGLCSFVSKETVSACDFSVPGIVNDPASPGKQILCCTGNSYDPVKADVQVLCSGNVVSAKRPVLFKGKLVSMVVTLFSAVDCQT